MPHAELPSADRDRVLGKLLSTYNRVHSTAYSFAVEEPAEDPSCDYLCIDPDRAAEPLKIQMTDAWTDPEVERIRPRFLEERVVRTLQAGLRARGLKGLHVSIDLDRRPPNEANVRALQATLLDAVCWAASSLDVPPGWRRKVWYNRDDVAHFYDEIRPFIQDLEVNTLPSAPDQVTVGFSSAHRDDGVADPSFRVVQALGPKAKKLGPSAEDLVLAIRCTVMPFSEEIDLPRIREELELMGLRFREVWVMNDFDDPSLPWAIRVWPIE